MVAQRPVVQAAKPSSMVKPVNAQSSIASESKAKVAKLNALMDAANEVTQKNSRLTGELNTLRKRMDEIGEKCKAEFECGIDQIPDLVQKLNEEADTRTASAEQILGMTPVVE